ncbi:hypothetical protein GAYE_SCF56G6340 [Galdieria yellowstonensis]|uniref:Uncharacterized protein n=1 Tax=Galdieria yellowstonensis TaxID=3028027 RepID=A0AAV9IM91_9RHOD|nr:hypothetical protein GAYE_SCF56G6340 [Galdieria yellowstonensis]
MSSFAELDKESSFYNVAIVDRRRDVFVVTNTFYKLQVCRDELLEETNYKRTLAVCSALIWVWKDRAEQLLKVRARFSCVGHRLEKRKTIYFLVHFPTST